MVDEVLRTKRSDARGDPLDPYDALRVVLKKQAQRFGMASAGVEAPKPWKRIFRKTYAEKVTPQACGCKHAPIARRRSC